MLASACSKMREQRGERQACGLDSESAANGCPASDRSCRAADALRATASAHAPRKRRYEVEIGGPNSSSRCVSPDRRATSAFAIRAGIEDDRRDHAVRALVKTALCVECRASADSTADVGAAAVSELSCDVAPARSAPYRPACSCPSFHSSASMIVTGQTKPPRLGPSGPRITGMSPVKSTAPTAYALS